MTAPERPRAGRVRRALAALGRCLSAFGAMHIALTDPHPHPGGVPGPDTPPGSAVSPGLSAAAAAAAAGGPPPAHPERLCAHRPLTEQELLLARQLWPASYPRRRGRGR
ncbi:DUF6059 family protein [Actinacidiphila acidipaludis]|uniref:Uncharacterized protein n=1 Tax=Actinacidiphila acidipaludis TaxID=2873382 RepID=A0ABS7QGS2_9ACTN|nr:DUF6059 family protein [Streptomyces acidipaludis]MBY8882365.1 hypothetical protein [Streptomyces acidipaludis]